MARSKSLRAKVCEKVCAELTAHLQQAAGIENGLSCLVVSIQRFGSAANLNIHFHVIALDGVRLATFDRRQPKRYLMSQLIHFDENCQP